MSEGITPGTPVRLTGPKPSTNQSDPAETPILPEGTAGVLWGPWEGNHEWVTMTVTYELPVRLTDVEPILDDGEGS